MPPPRIVTTEDDDIVSRVAPRWAWRAVDAALEKPVSPPAAEVELALAITAMILAGQADTPEPISRDHVRCHVKEGRP